MKSLLFGCLSILVITANAQVDSSSSQLTLGGYAELYYTYDFAQPADHTRPSFIYSHNRHNEVNLNLGFIKANYSTERVRGNLALAAGTYMNANYATEAGVLKNIYEANMGFKLSAQKNLWIDAGVFGSHIGFESAVSKDCWALTRSILADNSPYYESGAKVTYIPDNGKWLFSGLLLNGWQRIQRPDGNQTLGLGTQIMYTPSSQVTLNYSTFIGNDKPTDDKRMRYFHNLYGILKWSDHFHTTVGFDFGMEEQFKGAGEYYNWYSPIIIARYLINDQWAIAARAELYHDKDGVIIATGTEIGFQTTGYSVNIDWQLHANAVWRVEGRILSSKDDIFTDADGEATNTNTFVTTSMAFSF